MEALAAFATVTLGVVVYLEVQAEQTLDFQALAAAVSAAARLYSDPPAHVAPPECLDFEFAAIADLAVSAALVVAAWLALSASGTVHVAFAVLVCVLADLPRPIAAIVDLAVAVCFDPGVPLMLAVSAGVLKVERPALAL